MFAVVAIVVLWVVPKIEPATGTLVVVGAGRASTTLPATALSLRQAGTWFAAGTVSGDVPAAPNQHQLLMVAISAGKYDAVQVGDQTQPLAVTITAGQVEPLLLGIEAGRVIPGAVYAGNDDVNLGLGEVAGKFVSMPAFDLVDQSGGRVNLSTIAGRDVVIAAFHTTCHETCPLYTALFLQLAKHLPPAAMLLEVTTDPNRDTPSALASYAKQVGATWTFGTGNFETLGAFWKIFDVQLASGDTHTSTLALVDRHGYIRLVYRGVPKVGSDIPPSLVTALSTQGLHELGTGGDGWGAPDVLQALATISGPVASAQSGGGKVTNFSLPSTDGTKMSLSDYAGTPLVINFWATYCPPCRAEMPLLAQSIGAPSRIRLVLVNEGESRDLARAFLDGLDIHQAALLDSDTGVLRSYGLFALPTTIFVRADGTIDRRQVGQLDPNVLSAELSILGTQ